MLNYKFKFADINNMMGDIIMMRVAEMYLIKAEAAAHLSGKTSEAQALLKELRDARMKEGFESAAVTATGDELLKEIWLERRKELWGEGFSLTDIIRNQQSIERKKFEEYAIAEITYDSNGQEIRTPKLDENGDVVLAPEDATKEYKKKYCILISGHPTLKFPDGTDFEANSKYYLFRITEKEELQNQNLYNDHPKLSIYR